MKETKVYKSIQRFFAALKPMTWKERIEHIFSYYEELVFVFAMILAVVIIVGVSVSRNDKQAVFGGAFANVDINKIGYSYLTDGYMASVGADPETQYVDLSSTAFKEVTQVSELDVSYNAAMKPIAKIEEGVLDFLVMNEDAMEFYMTQYALMDLTEVFTKDQLAAMEDDLIYVYLEVEAIRYPIAIEVTDMPFFKDCADVTNPVYFGFTGHKEDQAEYQAFWTYLNNWKSAE